MTTYQAAQRVRAYLIKRYALTDEPPLNQPVIWTREESRQRGWRWAGDSVNLVWESSEGYDWPYRISEALFAGKLELPGIHVEPATGYALSFYND